MEPYRVSRTVHDCGVPLTGLKLKRSMELRHRRREIVTIKIKYFRTNLMTRDGRKLAHF
jgi:hypothetical protein